MGMSTLFFFNNEPSSDIMQKFADKCKKDPSIKMLFVGDFNRNTRPGGKNQQFKGIWTNSPGKIFLDNKPELPNWDVGFWRYPLPMEHMQHKKQLYSNIREIAGVHHPKWFVSDNDLLISGASQGHDLFLTRRDRYWVIRDCKELCDYAMDNM
jgi:hypothetical protein